MHRFAALLILLLPQYSVANSFFERVPQVIDLDLEEVASNCASWEFTTGKPIWEMILPTHINDDPFLDFVMIAFCANQEQLHGIEHSGPAISYLIPLVSTNLGDYRVATESVFGSEMPYIEHMPRKWVEEDFNGDGRTDFALAVNWDDGRLNQHVPYQIVLMSGASGTIEIQKIATPDELMAHAVSLASNGLGGIDVLWSGYCCFDGGVFAFRYQENRWIDVTSEYPNSESTDLGFSDFGTETRAVRVPGEATKKIVAMSQRDSEGNPIKGIGLWTKHESDWSLADDYGLSVVGQVDRYSWTTGQPEQIPVTDLNGRELIVDAFTQEGCIIEDDDKTYFMAQVSGLGLVGEKSLDRDRVYGTGESSEQEEFVSYSFFLDISDDRIIRADVDVIDEQIIEHGNYFQCEDLNDDGRIDFAMRNFSNSWRDNFTKLQTPYVYLNNGRGGFNYVDYEFSGVFENDFGEYEGLLEDVNGDGFFDLIRFAKSFGEGANLMHIHYGLTELFIDRDADGVRDSQDAFPLDESEAADSDSDGVGNNADTDDDNDGVLDSADAFPLDRDEYVDTDGDGIGNNADTDDDGDSFSDEQEAIDGTDPLSPFSCRYGCFSFDVDQSSSLNALTDGLLVMRHLFDFSGDTLVANATDTSAIRSAASDISSYLTDAQTELDIDGSGEVGALTDGLLLIRYLFDFRGESLISNAVDANATRNTAAEIETYIQARIPGA